MALAMPVPNNESERACARRHCGAKVTASELGAFQIVLGARRSKGRPRRGHFEVVAAGLGQCGCACGVLGQFDLMLFLT